MCVYSDFVVLLKLLLSSETCSGTVTPKSYLGITEPFQTSNTDSDFITQITNCLTKVVTETMIKELTGQGIPVYHELVGG